MKVRTVYMRGGTSKACFFRPADLPSDPVQRDRFLLRAYGSPDPLGRQLDGVGGAVSSTSKIAVVDVGADGEISYEFGQVAVGAPAIDRRGSCGNIAAAVGPYAIAEGLVPVTGDLTEVRIRDVNTRKLIKARVPTSSGEYDEVGQTAIPGVPTTGGGIILEHLDPGGSITGSTLPTRSVRDVIQLPSGPSVEVSVVDCAVPAVFVSADQVGLHGIGTAAELNADTNLLDLLEEIRGVVAVRLGLTGRVLDAENDSPAVPKVAVVAPATAYTTDTNEAIDGSSFDIRSCMISMGRVHAVYPVTGAIALAAAAAISDTVVSEYVGGGDCRVGTPGGVLAVRAAVTALDTGWRVDSARTVRTARRLLEGFLSVPDAWLAADQCQ